MSDQIREQVSAFLDGELPGAEAELLLKRLTRDAELRESFGRYALIGESMRGGGHARASRTFAARVNRAIDGAPPPAVEAPGGLRAPRWWRPFAGAAVAAGVATVAVVALQQRAVGPAAPAAPLVARSAVQVRPTEAISYTVPASVSGGAGAGMPAARLTNYVFAHSKYSSALGQRDVLTDLLVGDEDAEAARDGSANGAGVPQGDGAQQLRSPVQDARVSP